MHFARSFADELEKIAAVRGPVKQYRRLLESMAKKNPMHSTGQEGAVGIAKDRMVRTGVVNHYGRGTYWSDDGVRTRFGPSTVHKAGGRSMIKNVNDPERANWAVHKTEKGTPLDPKDLMEITREMPRAYQLSTSRAAQKAGMRVVNPEAASAVHWNHVTGEPLDKRKLIRADRKWRKQQTKMLLRRKEKASA
jgi:hypothetical protein